MKNERILFYKLQNESNALLTYILHQFSNEKNNLKEIHEKAYNQVILNGYDNSLDEIYNKINEGFISKPYNIYITDNNYIIVNTTYKPDIGFNLSFAKESFEKNKKENLLEVTAPIFESYSQKFFSYTDYFLPNSNRIFQVSYTYQNTDDRLNKIYSLVNKNTTVANYRAYLVLKDGYIGDFIFKKFKGRKLTLDEMEKVKEDAIKIFNRVGKTKLIEDNLKIDNNEYKVLYSKQESVIFDDIQILYSLTFDKSFLENEINKINIISIFLLLVGLAIFFILFKLRYKEILLKQKDKFIKHSVHEIKTPLSIILLNNQLRNKMKGKDKYSFKIEAAIKTLQNSYDDMTFLMTKDKLEYKIEEIELKTFLIERVDYFSTIAKSQGKEIVLNTNSNCGVYITNIELTRLIDNNLSNAIKYSELHSKIEVYLEKNILKFITKGNEIIEKKAIFDKYKREESSIGGHGLGLSIVKDIINKYQIKVEVERKNMRNIFIYHFKCHNTDTLEY
ncbi:sensor histidine kinase [Halarcobacter mediterraneus]|uniref:sensor histidine kinase n=1 Tax=Halarcobacter mediterraneus TaxID=2023153 RepID=UPI0013E96BA9|nr:HAMP domain-containing sensor histidine kinase [Halarcobacter mediterraneus]